MPIHDWTQVEAGTFHAFHQRWISALCDFYNTGGLPSGYFAMPEQIVGGPIPDVIALQAATKKAPKNKKSNGSVLVATPPQTRFVYRAESERYAQKADRIAIRHVRGRLIAVVEIVSPGNKGSRHAIRAFLEKLVDLLEQGVHLLVIDLFPPGPRDPQGIHRAIWDEITDETFTMPKNKSRILASYSAGPVKAAYVEALAVGDALPDMPLFIAPDIHVLTQLEATYQATWNVFPDELKELLE
jgi:Protein of unknown function (DUF4058)